MTKRLQKLLHELHSELNNPEAIDAESRKQLQGLADDIQAAIDSTGSAEGGENELQRAVLEFETEHPRIAGILGQIADALAKLGI